MLILNDISVRMAGRLLIDHANLNLPSGTKAGLVGRNGAGKSTLFKVITGEMPAETGDFFLPKNIRIGQVAQEAPGTEDSLLEIVLAADQERTALLAEAETATDPHRIAEIHIRLVDIDAHSAEARAGAILSGLGFDSEAQKRPASSFSGGWRMRVALAAVLFAEPDLLLLDEPTNYLDLEGTLWLEDYVRRYPHTVILISHDRDLLNSAVNSIIHLDQTKLTLWQGNYDQFERLRSEALELQQKQRTKQEAHRKHMEAFVERFRAKASKAKQAQSRLKALQKLKPISSVIEDHVAPFHFPEPEKVVASPIIAIENGEVGYTPGKPVLKHLNLRIDADDRIALLGSNGNGKSTLAKLISGRLPLQSGRMTVAPNLKISFFAQHQLDDLVPEDNAIEHVRKLMPDAPESKVRARVSQMGLATVKMNTAAKDLSGGEKARLLMGLSTFQGPNLLILDEPTNHLDIDSREALMHALNDFDGAVILIAHDRHLIEATMDRLWLVRDGAVAPYDGDLDAYRSLVLADAKAERSGNSKITADDGQKLTKAEQRKLSAQKREALKPLQKKIQEADAMVQRFQKKIETLQDQLADPVIYSREPARATQIGKEIGYAKSSLARAEEEWLTLSTEYEEAMADL
ncbi:ABC-F family ATP-binding cassette domain-containing protein [Phyllobacterium myrsinacearum]|uniref:Glycosyl transferase family 1 n=1 Tax=Phyllobacterium myrsinacearum TaxID=28101 RepID=A0A2S9JDM7_9HYPH|nr:ABC-F family ATP-binding cassette domain-containing protein [Phyllobacterium myrsinacearum]PRD50997.1 glycosyl transferase family 1 [Phyllobacterium myrsinacearum]PWV88297.1 ATP-binding cassette subfamily F protein 3 [Phyllobacterium myrsinacearum]RZS88739.1 ATP-binding cassette subfamily F protein 3 [Phyllobacterium myrsinacearum]RZU97588.1 ATP-binding cassette subfamily F protein 3 [Phyllobacterium myrsinacearum]